MIVLQTSVSGPYERTFHHDAQLVDFEHAIAFDVRIIPVSFDPFTPFDHLAPPDSGLSFARLKPSSVDNGSAGLMADDRVVAGMNVNVWDVTDPIRSLIRAKPVERAA